MKNNVPVYQYRDKIDGEWLPPLGRTIWREDPDNLSSVLLPIGDPDKKEMENIHKRSEEIIYPVSSGIHIFPKGCLEETRDC
ncbi:unnamed protein product [Calypogeia fissa]